MALQISLEQARSLGLLARVNLADLSAKGEGAVPRTTPARAALEAALAPRTSAKGGRHARKPGEPTESISFMVDHPPRTKQRARTQISKQAIERAFMQARGSLREFSRLLAAIPHTSFTPKTTKEFEKAIGAAAAEAMAGRALFAGPVEVEVAFVFRGDETLWPTDVTDADLDNLEKAALDGLNKKAYTDDRLVVRKIGVKECGPVAGVRLRVSLLPA